MDLIVVLYPLSACQFSYLHDPISRNKLFIVERLNNSNVLNTSFIANLFPVLNVVSLSWIHYVIGS